MYWAGDTVLTPEVLRIIDTVRPDVIVTHSGGAVMGGTLLIMNEAQTIEICRHAEDATVIAVHMEALDHCVVTRNQLRAVANQAGIPRHRLLIPADGEQVQR